MVKIIAPPPAAPPKPAKPADERIIVTPFVILQDQQEGAPWTFDGLGLDDELTINPGDPYDFADLRADAKDRNRPLLVQKRVCHLKTGDYSIEGLEHLVTVERKSKEDLFGTLAGGRERFEREHERMQAMVAAGGRAAVVVECSIGECLNDPPEWSKLPPEIVRRTSISWQPKYQVQWHFCDTRRLAEEMCFLILQNAWREVAHA